MSGGNSAVECQLPKLDVAGSIPVPRSNFSVTWKQCQIACDTFVTLSKPAKKFSKDHEGLPAIFDPGLRALVKTDAQAVPKLIRDHLGVCFKPVL